ncbi:MULTISPECIES: FAD-dependent monooxygenase [Streptosporangium]|uniref:2-polyprenyl-6-methoxyphenol hydroxylase-like FAD-dependent oxidoreductase n=1 Tax=Streptosporangium brasiliense TaxID=47480 RepID=A0ABT9QWP1_9ACTN|nr:FAD-dependent monooxygenase [Streptosporangium brasiliense]MDP9861374.1 2-polyprenyl-6-methoxyphenol hydroxylase-like FAD-dependent oxidoreductase [Streptosporangium brasiliense]
MTAGRTAVIVGGGIGGLAAAVALCRRGWRVEVCEQAAQFTEIGAGLSLWPNALRALAVLGLADRVRELGAVEAGGGVRDRAGRWLARTDNVELEQRFGWPLVVVHRADLVRVLVEALPRKTLRPATTITGVHDEGDAVVVEHHHGSLRAEVAVGADGLHSTVRRLGRPDARPPRYAGYTAWRMITSRLPAPLTDGASNWGRGERFGYTSMPGNRAYCFATATVPAGGVSPDGEWAELHRRFGRWAGPIPTLLAAVAEDDVLRHDIYDLPPLSGYVSGRVALLGDAAHAMTPNLGQGACQALEDAVVLASCLDRAPDIASGLAGYDRRRRSRTQDVVRRSARLGAVGQWSWPPAVKARDLAARLTPNSATLRSMTPILGWKP